MNVQCSNRYGSKYEQRKNDYNNKVANDLKALCWFIYDCSKCPCGNFCHEGYCYYNSEALRMLRTHYLMSGINPESLIYAYGVMQNEDKEDI